MQDIDFQRPKYGQPITIPSAPTKQVLERCHTDLKADEIESLRAIAPRAALFSCLDIKQQVELPLTPYEALSKIDDVEGIDVFEVLKSSLTSASIQRLSSMTMQQAKSKLWKKHRKGRITGSKMHNVYTLRESTSRANIVKSILGLTPDIKTPSMMYGIKNEDNARAAYTKYQKEFHENFTCELSGLILNENHPHLGSSPDGIVECSCCGKGCLEIKCLAKYKDGLPGPFISDDPHFNQDEQPALTDKDISLYPLDDDFQLKKTHQYYTQVQGHMLITDYSYCDLYLWSKSRSIATRVYRDDAFIYKLCEKLKKEYLTHVVPKLMAKTN